MIYNHFGQKSLRKLRSNFKINKHWETVKQKMYSIELTSLHPAVIRCEMYMFKSRVKSRSTWPCGITFCGCVCGNDEHWPCQYNNFYVNQTIQTILNMHALFLKGLDKYLERKENNELLLELNKSILILSVTRIIYRLCPLDYKMFI